jgi:outer membrane biosynthesis protein TonB
VRVTVNEQGHNIEAKAVGGHPLLREAAVAAAKLARLTPTFLSGRPVKVTGTLIYNFKL